MLRREFRAMGARIELLLDAEDDRGLLEPAEEEFHRLEQLLSRFRPDSELARLNRLGELEVGPELLELTELALAARERTGGRFDPTVHDALTAAGYDRSFEHVNRSMPSGQSTDAALCGGGVAVDRTRSRIELEPGFRLDLGGIAKGWAADRALARLRSAGPALVNAGGDLAAGGRSWPVGVETPARTVTLELESGGLATSGRDRRRWLQDGRECHHLIDPATGQPSESDVATVTVAASTAVEAEVLAKAMFLAGGVEQAAREADALGVPAVLVTDDGTMRLAGGLA